MNKEKKKNLIKNIYYFISRNNAVIVALELAVFAGVILAMAAGPQMENLSAFIAENLTETRPLSALFSNNSESGGDNPAATAGQYGQYNPAAANNSAGSGAIENNNNYQTGGSVVGIVGGTSPILFEETDEYIKLNFTMFKVEFYKGSAGYNKIYNRFGEVLAGEERIVLEYLFQQKNWKQRGTATGISWEKIDDYHYRVARNYDDSAGTTYQVIYDVKADSPMKITVVVNSGQTETYRLSWQIGGLTKTKYKNGGNKITFGDAQEDYGWLIFDWEDAYRSFGNIAETNVESVERGKKAEIYFNLGKIEAGQQITLDPSIVGTSTNVDATRDPFQRKSFYAAGRFWVFYNDGATGIVFRSSTDGMTWTTSTLVTNASYSYHFSVFFDTTYVHYAYYDNSGTNYDLFYRRGTPQSDGGIEWSAAQQTVDNGNANDYYYCPMISVDSAGYAWIGADYYDGTNRTPWVFKNNNNDGTWANASGFPYQLNSYSDGSWRVTVVPLTNQKVYVLYILWGDSYGRLYNNGWHPENLNFANYNSSGNHVSAVNEGDTVHLAYVSYESPVNIRYNKWASSTGWGTDTVIQGNVSSSSDPVLSRASSTNDIYCFWGQKNAAYHIRYKRLKGGNGNWDIAPTEWIDESTELLKIDNSRLTGFYQSYNNKIGLMYMTRSVSPFNVKFSYLDVTPQLLTFREKYVIKSFNATSTTSSTLVDDYAAVQSFSLTESKTVLVIYNPHNYDGSTESNLGKKIGVNIDGTDYALTSNSSDTASNPNGAITFWLGTLVSGTHTIKGRYASVDGLNTVIINERVLLVYIFDGNEFRYIDNDVSTSTNQTTFTDDVNTTTTFTPLASCKGLFLYNTWIRQDTTNLGAKIAINLSGTDYSQSEKASTGGGTYNVNIFTLHYAALSQQSYTVRGRFAANEAQTVTVMRRQLAVLLFSDSALADYITSDTQVSTASAYPVNDSQAVINRTTSDTRELLVLAMGTKRNGTGPAAATNGEAYGIQIDAGESATSTSRGCPSYGNRANSASTAFGKQLSAASHTIRGRFGINGGSDTAYIDSRRMVALWFVPYAPSYTPLTFYNKYVISSSNSTSTTGNYLVDDYAAVQTFSLIDSKTVLIIYAAHNAPGASQGPRGRRLTIDIDGNNYAETWDSVGGASGGNSSNRQMSFWLGTLGAGSHTVKGRYSSVRVTENAAISERVLLIYIFNGNEYYYLDDIGLTNTNSTVNINDPYATLTFTPSGTANALFLYNLGNAGDDVVSNDWEGKKAAINVNGTDYSRADKGTSANGGAESIFTLYYSAVTAQSYTVKGRFADNTSADPPAAITRRQLGVLIFSNSIPVDYLSNDTQISTTSNSLVNDNYGKIERTTGDTRELLVIAVATKNYNVSSNLNGEVYGIKINANDRAKSRGEPGAATYGDSAPCAYGEQLLAGSHTIQGRFSNNAADGSTAVYNSRRIIALWFPPFYQPRPPIISPSNAGIPTF